jgi:hypothetical protein
VGETNDVKRAFLTKATSIDISNSPTELKIDPKVPKRNSGDRNQVRDVAIYAKDIKEQVQQ